MQSRSRWHIAAYFEVVVDKVRRARGAKNFFEREFTLAARARIAAIWTEDKRSGDSGDLYVWAARATGEVERSEGEGRGVAPPGVGLGDLPASWRACCWSSVGPVGDTASRLYCWMVWRRRSVRGTSRGGAAKGNAEAGWRYGVRWL